MVYVICRTEIDEVVGTIFYKKENDLKPTGKFFFGVAKTLFYM